MPKRSRINELEEKLSGMEIFDLSFYSIEDTSIKQLKDKLIRHGQQAIGNKKAPLWEALQTFMDAELEQTPPVIHSLETMSLATIDAFDIPALKLHCNHYNLPTNGNSKHLRDRLKTLIATFNASSSLNSSAQSFTITPTTTTSVRSSGLSLSSFMQQSHASTTFQTMLQNTSRFYEHSVLPIGPEAIYVHNSLVLASNSNIKIGMYVLASNAAIHGSPFDINLLVQNVFYIFKVVQLVSKSNRTGTFPVVEYINFVNNNQTSSSNNTLVEAPDETIELDRSEVVSIVGAMLKRVATAPVVTSVDSSKRLSGVHEYPDELNGKTISTIIKNNVSERLVRTAIIRRMCEVEVLNYLSVNGSVIDIDMRDSFKQLVDMGMQWSQSSTSSLSVTPQLSNTKLYNLVRATTTINSALYTTLFTDGWAVQNRSFSYKGITLQSFLSTTFPTSDQSTYKTLISRSLQNLETFLVFTCGSSYVDITKNIRQSLDSDLMSKEIFDAGYCRFSIEKMLYEAFSVIKWRKYDAIPQHDLSTSAGVVTYLTDVLSEIITNCSTGNQDYYFRIEFPKLSQPTAPLPSPPAPSPPDSSFHCKFDFLKQIQMKTISNNDYVCTQQPCKFSHSSLQGKSKKDMHMIINELEKTSDIKGNRLVSEQFGKRMHAHITSTWK
jgi:hypothetical protein